MRSTVVVHSEARAGGVKGNIVRAMFPFISGHRCVCANLGVLTQLVVSIVGRRDPLAAHA